MKELKTPNDAEILFRDIRLYKAMTSGRMIKHVAEEFHLCEKTVRAGKNRVQSLILSGTIDEEIKKARKILGLFEDNSRPYMPEPARTSSGVRFTPL